MGDARDEDDRGLPASATLISEFVEQLERRVRKETAQTIEERVRRELTQEFQAQLAARDKTIQELSPDAVLRRLQSKFWLKGDVDLLREAIAQDQASPSSGQPRFLYLSEAPVGTMAQETSIENGRRKRKRTDDGAGSSELETSAPVTKLSVADFDVAAEFYCASFASSGTSPQ